MTVSPRLVMKRRRGDNKMKINAGQIFSNPFIKWGLIIGGGLIIVLLVTGKLGKNLSEVRKNARQLFEDRLKEEEIKKAAEEISNDPNLTNEQKAERIRRLIDAYNVDPQSEFAKTIVSFLPYGVFLAPPQWMQDLWGGNNPFAWLGIGKKKGEGG